MYIIGKLENNVWVYFTHFSTWASDPKDGLIMRFGEKHDAISKMDEIGVDVQLIEVI